MSESAYIFNKLTGKEFFKPKSIKMIGHVFDSLVKEVSSKKVILVGGTNGKGETCYSLEWFAKNLGVSCAVFTSPHLHTVHERFRFNGAVIEDSKLLKLLKKFQEKYPENSCDLSYFELCFWVFCNFVIEKSPELVICEVGLGGRLDITNLLEPSITAITNISRDHTEYLGSTYKKILFEKLGVTRRGVKLFTGVSTDYLIDEVKRFSLAKEFPVTYLKPKNDYSSTNKFMAQNIISNLYNNYEERINLQDLYGKVIDPRTKNYESKFGTSINFRGAHNLDGHRCLIKSLGSYNKYSCIILNFSNRPKEEVKSILVSYSSWTGGKVQIYVNTTPFFKSSSKEKLSSIVKELALARVEVLRSTNEIKKAVSINKSSLWTGSYYSCELINELI
jgi:dihydrofolate synthase / folylpolyglutamate synthase